MDTHEGWTRTGDGHTRGMDTHEGWTRTGDGHARGMDTTNKTFYLHFGVGGERHSSRKLSNAHACAENDVEHSNLRVEMIISSSSSPFAMRRSCATTIARSIASTNLLHKNCASSMQVLLCSSGLNFEMLNIDPRTPVDSISFKLSSMKSQSAIPNSLGSRQHSRHSFSLSQSLADVEPVATFRACLRSSCTVAVGYLRVFFFASAMSAMSDTYSIPVVCATLLSRHPNRF